MATLTIADVAAGIKINPAGMKLKFRSKNDETVKYKCLAKSVDKKANKVTVEALEGPSEGKTLSLSIERLLRQQGRQVGTSPASSKKAETSTSKQVKKEKVPAKATAKKASKQEETEELNLESAQSEVLDIAELLQDMIKRLNTLHAFLNAHTDGSESEDEEEEDEDTDESEEEEDEEEESPAPKKKAGTKKRKPMSEED